MASGGRTRSLAGKVAIVTGGSSGIGQAVATGFAAAGARVVIAARNVERGEAAARSIRDGGGEAVFIRADMAEAADIEALITRTVELHGRIDCCCNNAAGTDGPSCGSALMRRAMSPVSRWSPMVG